jgi:hypothetical protein
VRPPEFSGLPPPGAHRTVSRGVRFGVTGCTRVASWLPVESGASFSLWVGAARAAGSYANRLLDGAAGGR